MARHTQENFPVASVLLPRRAQEGVLALYAFARGADDLADDPAVLPARREQALRALDTALQDTAGTVPPWTAAYVALCREGKCDIRDGRDLLRAFIQDQRETRCADWEAMLDYCRYSAYPVGRSFLSLCGEEEATKDALFALCACLQIVNHIQDIRPDYTELGRIYLPGDWLREAGVEEEDVGKDECSPGLRQVIDRVLDALVPWLEQAHSLPAQLKSRRLRAELRWVLAVLRQLHRRLKRQDPLARRVRPGFSGKVGALLCSFLPFSSPSSFYWPMRLAGKQQQRALFALHRFLRAMDHATDRVGADQRALALWREECALLRQQKAATAEGKALLPHIVRFGLNVDHLEEVLKGCGMDIEGQTHQPSASTLALYCQRVAVAPGRLVLAILGQNGETATALAHALGQAFQRTNIMRDEKEDAALGRTYFPPLRRREFMEETEAYFRQADRLLLAMETRKLLPVLLMRDVYWRLFLRLRARKTPPAPYGLLPWLLTRRLFYCLRGI